MEARERERVFPLYMNFNNKSIKHIKCLALIIMEEYNYLNGLLYAIVYKVVHNKTLGIYFMTPPPHIQSR